jgi:hypothetical protein
MLALLAAVLVADLLTGFGHWLEDNYCRPGRGSWLERHVCGPNLRHHVDQIAMTAGPFLHRNWTAFAFAWGAAVLLAAIGAAWWIVLAAVLAGFGNEIHAWNHRRPAHWLPRLLQSMAIVQTAHNHARHHRSPHDAAYCTLTNVCNPLLDALRVWRGLEWIVARVTGRRPNHELTRQHGSAEPPADPAPHDATPTAIY